jgi:hypothetical protein
MGSILTHTFGTYTVFRTIHSIYENTNEVASCIVAFTPCDDIMLSTMEYELQDVFDTFDYLLKNQFDLFAKSAVYKGNSSPLDISELVDEVIETMEKNYNFYRCSIEIVKPIEDVYLEELTGIRDMNKTKEIRKVDIKFVDGMVTDVDREKAKKSDKPLSGLELEQVLN